MTRYADEKATATILTQAELEALPLCYFIEPYRKNARRIEVRVDDDGIACVGRWDNTAKGEKLTAWKCVGRIPEWFIENNNPGRWMKASAAPRKETTECMISDH